MRRIAICLCLLPVLARLVGADDAELKRLLDSTLPENREKAAGLLGKQDKTAAEKRLVRMLKDRDWGVRMTVIRALGQAKMKASHDALVEQALEGEIKAIRVLAARVLREHDNKRAAEQIARSIKRYKKEARLPAILALGIIGGDAAVGALLKQVRSPNQLHRAAAVRALGRLGAGEKWLVGALKDKEDEIRMLAASALSRLDSDVARTALLDYIERNRKPWDGYILRRIGQGAGATQPDKFAAAIAPRLKKSKQAVALLQIAAEGRLEGCAATARGLFKHRDILTRCFAYRVAGLGAPLGLADVQPALDHKDVRLNYAAVQAFLRSQKDQATLTTALRAVISHKKGSVADVGVRLAVEKKIDKVLPELTALAQGRTRAKKEWKTRVAACVGMGRIGKKKAFDDLALLAKAREWWLRAAAMEGLYHTFDKRSIPIYIGSFLDKHPVVRMTLRRNLKYLTRKHYAQKKLYEKWWQKHGKNVELIEPDEYLRQAKKYGYATPKYVQDVLKGTDIVVILGRWDKVQLVLEDLQIKHFAIRQQQVGDYGLSPKQVVLVNCEGSVDNKVTSYLQWFVAAGGYMATTDWALVNALNKTFPGVLAGWVKQSTGNDVVVVEPADPKNPMVQGVFSDEVDLKWWLEIQAFPIAIHDPVRATVIVDSMEMLIKYGSSVMMAQFEAGLGKVMHSTSHFYLQKEGFASQGNATERRVFAADHLGIPIDDIRKLDAIGAFDNVNDTKKISKSYSMFLLLVNFLEEKRSIDRR